MALQTVFDGILPASPDAGLTPGAPVIVWTPTVSGVYRVMVTAVDDPATPFATRDDCIVDAGQGGILEGLFQQQSPSTPFQEGVSYPSDSAALSATNAAVRVVVRVELVASPTGSTSSSDGMVVGLDDLKRALQLDLTDTADDQLLVDLEARAAAWVEEQTERRWHAPAAKVEIVQPKGGSRFLRLGGHVDDPDGDVTLRRRGIYGGSWETVDESEFEREGDKLVALAGYWSRGFDYEATYLDGWTVAPKDVQDLVIDLVSISYFSIGDEGVKSESIGDYSYTLDTAVTAAGVTLTDSSSATLNRRRPMHV